MERAATGLQINSNYFAISGYIQARYWRTQIKISSVGKPRPLKSDMADTSAINDQSVIDLPNCPFGGEKNSGIADSMATGSSKPSRPINGPPCSTRRGAIPGLRATFRTRGHDQTRTEDSEWHSKQEHGMAVVTAVPTISLPSSEAIPLLG